jgi:methionyl-tRNA formyltransferase
MISIFAMTERGFKVISEIIKEFGSSFIELVVSAKDDNIKNDYYKEIEELCKKNNIIFRDRKDEFEIRTIYCFTIGWRWIIEFESQKKLIVFHDSLLPKYRGFAPLVNSLINGEKEIGVTALFASEEYDKGDVIFQSKTKIEYPIKIEKAIELNNENYINCALFVSKLIKEGSSIQAKSQNESEATYSLWRDEEDYKINWNASAIRIKRFIDATGTPYKGAFTMLEKEKIRIFDAEVLDDLKIMNRDVGKVIFVDGGNPVIVCGSGLLKITTAFYDDIKTSFLPLKKFRIRLQ